MWSQRLTWNAHLSKTIHPSQAGFRSGRQTIDVAVQKEHKYLYSVLTRTTLMTMDNDAKACYKMIICNQAILVSQYYGMPQNICKTQAKTLKSIKFSLRTAMRIQITPYTHSEQTPFHGWGQYGFKKSSVSMKCQENSAQGITMVPIQQKDNNIQSIIEGFLEDTSLFVKDQESLEKTIRRITKVSEQWAELIFASVCKLELTKCFYYSMF